ncbi:Lrp/AsnC family transcriptional regulator [archaeon]|nr:Lrp/AsnC family transcriptional regulator [archaeon]
MEKAYVLLIVEIGSEKEVFTALEDIPEVKEAYQIYAVYDLIIHVEAETQKKLKALINRIRDIEKVRSMMTLICV